MSAWVELLEDNILAVMSETEVRTIRTKLVSSNQEDPVPNIIATVVSDVRAAARANADNTVDSNADKIPPESVRYAAFLVRHSLLSRLDMSISDGRRQEYNKAEKFLDDVRTGKFTVSNPNAAEDAKAPTVTPSVEGRTPSYGRSDQDGI